MTRPRPALLVASGAAVLVVLVALVVWRVADSGGSSAPSAAVVRDVGAARSPFTGLTAGTIRVGGRSLHVVVADSESERIQGLRGRSDAAPYDGMLFVFPSPSRVAFTMAGVPAPLDIAFYASDGTVVDQMRMEPCQGTDATCPIYEAQGSFRYALETAPGGLPDGPLRVA